MAIQASTDTTANDGVTYNADGSMNFPDVYSPTSSTDTTGTGTGGGFNWGGLFTGLLGTAANVYTTTTASNNAAAAAAAKAANDRLLAGAQVNNSMTLSKVVPWIIGGVILIGVIFFGAAFFRKSKS